MHSTSGIRASTKRANPEKARTGERVQTNQRFTHFWKWRCFAPLSLAEHGERTLSVGETMDLVSVPI